MATSGELTASPLNANPGFNWVFLIELLVCGVLTLFFLFYFNRVFATLVSYGLRAWTWHRYRVYVDIQALQISLLGGRIFFKGFKYHGNNETILIHSGYVTWNYWLRNVRELDVGRSQIPGTKRASTDSSNGRGEEHNAEIRVEEEGIPKTSVKLPCRLNISLQGVEWFVYNRSAAYDSIVASLAQNDDESAEPIFERRKDAVRSDSKLRRRQVSSDQEKATSSAGFRGHDSPSTENSSYSNHPEEQQGHDSSSTSQSEAFLDQPQAHERPEQPFLLRLLPIHIECNKAAVVLGNENTKSVLITKAEGASGEIDASRSGILDQYKQLINFKFTHPVIQMKPNDDYKEDQAAAASHVKRGEEDNMDMKGHHIHSRNFFHHQRRRVWHTLQDLIPAFRSSVESFSSSLNGVLGTPTPNGHGSQGWQGLSRYLDENEQDDNARWASIEYATVSTIADSTEAYMSFYWDVAGIVPHRSTQPNLKYGMDTTNINGDLPPDWGLDLSFKGATFNYGPWADRQRADIQHVFFPSLCKNAKPAEALTPGQFRLPTQFKMYIEFEDETTLRIPIREESKNWKWSKQSYDLGTRPGQQKRNGNKGRKRKVEKGNPGPEIRPFGWIDIKVGVNATVQYVMDMVAGPSGFSNKVELDLPNVEITTSVNHGLLWRSSENRLLLNLSNPLQWNGFRPWIFDVNSNGLELFILREHIFLLIDLVDDWASGPPPEYLTFTPFKYLINLRLGDFRIYLNVNDSNIINNPSDFDDNTFVSIFGSVLTANITIPLDKYRPIRNAISFDVNAQNGGLSLHVPPWNTQATFLSTNELATLKELVLNGKYQYCSTTSTGNTDTLLLNVHGNSPSAQFYGFAIRYYLKLKDNYFGSDIRFKTLEEYQEVLQAKRKGQNELSSPQPPHKKSNDLDVILGITAENSSVILPANLYSSKDHTRIEIASLAADLRFTNYYMDLDVTLCTLAFSQGDEEDGAQTPISATSSTELFIDGVTVTGNRLFGLPPAEPTYLCNWDFTVGAVSGECTTEFFGRLATGVRAFAFSFDDDENALPVTASTVLHDITFLRASLESLHVWLHVDEAAFLLSTETISVVFNDWAGSHYSKKLNLQLPELRLACVDAESASRHRSRSHQPVETHALVQTTLSFVMIQRKLGFEKDRKLQQEHIKYHDQRTHRTDFLLHDGLVDDSVLVPVDPPAMCFPQMPSPIARDRPMPATRPAGSIRSSLRSERRRLDRKSSFLSISSSSLKSSSSIVRPQSSRRLDESQISEARRSRSLQTSTGPSRRIPLRDVSTSTGRQSSFYSAMGDHRGLPPSSVTFSTSYLAPYFPLEGVEPDTSDLPHISPNMEDEFYAEDKNLGLDDIRPDRVNDSSTHTSFIVELPKGVVGVFDPKAVHAIAGLLGAMKPVDPSDILDQLHIDSLNQIFDLRKQMLPKAQVLDLNIRTSGINLRFMSSSTSVESIDFSDGMHDQYDLAVSRLAVTFRSENAVADEETLQAAHKSSSIHVVLRSAGIAAKERHSDIDDPQAAINSIVEDLAFWLVSGEETTANLAFKDFEVATASSKIEYLASLVHRTQVQVSDLVETFSSRLKQHRNRIQLFTFLVATAGQHAADPSFFTRPSYVLRSAENHIRTTDSWKLITRLRYMYTNLPLAMRNDIVTRCLSNMETAPDDAREQVLAGFDQWRSWDLNDVHTCLVMTNIYGSTAEGSLTESKPQPLKLSFRTEDIRLLLDPGPKQNEVSFSNISVALENRTSISTVDIDPQADAQYSEKTTVEVFCGDASINLNWELCELAENIIHLYQKGLVLESSRPQSPSTPVQSSSISRKHDLHVLIATERGSIVLETVNIRAALISKSLRTSFILVDDPDAATERIASLMLAAEAVTSKIKSHSQELSLYQLRYPSIYVSHEAQVVDDLPLNTIKIAGNCQELSFVVRQDILVLIEVLDLVIGDEVEQLYQLQRKLLQGNATREQISRPTTKESLATKINVALFLDMYHISVPLLHSLTYNVSGVVARASVAAQLNSEIIFDFDLKEHSHDIQTVVAGNPRSISLLQMPTTNGRITSHMSEEENIVSMIISVEPIELDASAVHSLLTALNRPEISSVVADIQEDVKGVQTHLKKVFGPQKKPKLKATPIASKPFIFDAHITLAGFDIFANAHGVQNGQNTARLDLNLGCVQLVLANRLEANGPVLEFPELRVSLHHIMFELSRLNKGAMEPCGNVAFTAFLTATSKKNYAGDEVRSLHLKSDGLEINLFADTASSVVEVIGYLQSKIKNLDLSREKEYLRKLRKSKIRASVQQHDEQDMSDESASGSSTLFDTMYSLELTNIQVSWLLGTYETDRFLAHEPENLVFSLKCINLSTKKANSARLTIEDLQLQMVPASHHKTQRSPNSALLPEIIFNVGYVSTTNTRRLAFQAAGKSLDLRLTSQFMIPASEINKSISSASEKVRAAGAMWGSPPAGAPAEATHRRTLLGQKRIESLLIDADFAGAVVYLSGKKLSDTSTMLKIRRLPQEGKYGQFTDSSSNTVLRAPGFAWKIEYKDNGFDDPSLNTELKVHTSSNILYPSVVPLIMEISSTVKDIVSNDDGKKSVQSKSSPQKFMGDEDNILTADPSAVLGRTKLNIGLRICRQEFSLSCQPIARVAATARFNDIYVTMSTVRSTEHGHFFAISAAIKNLQASIQHVYSRESTGSFEVESVFLSLMNSKHLSGTSGISAILKITPMKILVNAKQLQDFLLFREIWVPPEIRQSTTPDPALANSTSQSQTILVQRYQQVAATGAFPWNATVSIEELDVQLDLGQAIGKSAFMISKFWISSKKTSDWEQNLCLGFEKIGVDSTGRMSGFVALQDFRMRTSIAWPARQMALNQTPLIQGSVSFSQMRLKAAFDYQAFLVADITSLSCIIYNVRSPQEKGDRLVAIVDGEAVQVFCTTTSASQALALYQAFQKLVQERKANYETSLVEIERFMKRKSVHPLSNPPKDSPLPLREDKDKIDKSPISLHTDVIVTLNTLNIGAFPNTFSDHQVFKLEALNAQARFAVTMEDERIHSILALTLGQLRIGLAGVKKIDLPKSASEISVEDVVSSATGSRGGTILKVPKVEAAMQTWQVPGSNQIDYIFRSAFEGKVEVGWNYSRISYIRSMWASHSKALAQRLGKPLPPSAVKITGVPDEEGSERKVGEQQKITAEVNVPQSKYEYTALEPPIIETPQLRDMGEATPPLEWIGLHRDRLPNVVHQIVIVTLLELASEVEDAYGKILGSF